ncbi:MAG: PTS transporter subunit IIC [Halanaerobiaceae bacterium]
MDLLYQILAIPGILVGLITMVGLIVQSKSLYRVLYGTIRTVLGFLILTLGVEITLTGLKTFDTLFSRAFQLQGIYLDDNVAVGAIMSSLGDKIGLIMVLGFLVNLLIARFTPVKWIYLTGHKIWHLAGSLTLLFMLMEVPGWITVAVSSLILGCFLSFQPWLIQPWVKKVTGRDDIGLGHTVGIIAVLAAVTGKIAGKTAGNLKRPDGFDQSEIIDHLSISLSVIIFLMFAVPVYFVDAATLNEITGQQHPFVYIMTQSLKVTAGIIIVLQGVKLFMTELIPAFKGIANRVVPQARPALDVPVLFAYSPRGVTIGLVSSFLGWVLATYLCSVFGLLVVPVPSMMGVMFGGTTAGIFGYATGDRRGAVFAGFFCGIIWPVLVAIVFPILDFHQLDIAGTGILTPDIYILLLLVKFFAELFH